MLTVLFDIWWIAVIGILMAFGIPLKLLGEL
jgi:hypothetical protein